MTKLKITSASKSHGPKLRELVMKGNWRFRTFWLPNGTFLGWEGSDIKPENREELQKAIGENEHDFSYWYVMGLKYFMPPTKEDQKRREVESIEEIDLHWNYRYENLALSAAKMIGDEGYEPGFEPCFLQSRIPVGVMIY